MLPHMMSHDVFTGIFCAWKTVYIKHLADGSFCTTNKSVPQRYFPHICQTIFFGKYTARSTGQVTKILMASLGEKMSPDEVDEFFVAGCRSLILYPFVAVVSGFGNVKWGFPLEENTPPHLFSTKIYKDEISQVVEAHLFAERTVLQVPCRCRPSSLAHLDEFHTSFKLHGLEMRTTGSFFRERWLKPCHLWAELV